MRTKTIQLFQFDELSDDAKEKARDWYRQGALDYEWWEFIFDDAKRIGLKITGFDLDCQRHCTGELTKPVLAVCQSIMAEHGMSCDTYKLALRYISQFEQLYDELDRAQQTDEDGNKEYELEGQIQDLAEEFTKDLLEEYSVILQHEYEYLLSDEQVDELIQCNEYEFTKDGERT